MRHPSTFLLLCVFWIPLSWTPYPAADQYPPTGLMGVVPAPDAPQESIRLDSGEATIRLGQRIHVVDGVFEFYNTGETTKQKIGFPIPIDADGRTERARPTSRQLSIGGFGGSLELPAPQDPNIRFLEMEVRVDGKRVVLSEDRDFLKRGGFSSKGQDSWQRTQEPRWMVSTVTFPGHAKTAIRFSFTSWSGQFRTLRLGYGTGRTWKGNIGKLVFIIDCADVGGTKNVSVTTDSLKFSGKGLRGENLIIREEHDFEPTAAAHITLDVDPYRTEIYKAAGTHESDDDPRPYAEWDAAEGHPAQMWSKVDYDPKLNDPFFRSNEWSYRNGSQTYIPGMYVVDAPRKFKHTAKCFSTSFGVEREVRFCEAKLLDEDMLDLLIHEKNPAFRDSLRVRIREGKFTCQYWILDGVGAVTWTTKRQKLTLDKKVYQKGDVIKGRIDFECLSEFNPKYAEKFGRDPRTIKVFGVFKTIVE